jgi:cell fate (sporulation/competence/biofilm development) regulator YlbF (YheA/YmcA/DUF963 family)
MERQAILETAWETVDEIKTSALYQRYIASLHLLESSLEIAPLIREFTEKKAIYENMRTENPYASGLKAAAAALAEAKTALFARPEHQDYLQHQKALNNALQAIGQQIQGVLDEVQLGKKQHCSGR